jgi:hypothetical protein
LLTLEKTLTSRLEVNNVIIYSIRQEVLPPMLTKIKCPKCNTEGQISLLDPLYDGPYKCWKCRELLHIKLENGSLKSVVAVTPEEAAKFEQIQALKNKFAKG